MDIAFRGIKPYYKDDYSALFSNTFELEDMEDWDQRKNPIDHIYAIRI